MIEGILGFSAGSSILLVNFLGVLTARLLLVWSRIVRPLGSGVNPNLEYLALTYGRNRRTAVASQLG